MHGPTHDRVTTRADSCHRVALGAQAEVPARQRHHARRAPPAAFARRRRSRRSLRSRRHRVLGGRRRRLPAGRSPPELGLQRCGGGLLSPRPGPPPVGRVGQLRQPPLELRPPPCRRLRLRFLLPQHPRRRSQQRLILPPAVLCHRSPELVHLPSTANQS